MARDSAVGRERILVVPSSLALDNTTANQHVPGAQNDLNQQILEVSFAFSCYQMSCKNSNKTSNTQLRAVQLFFLIQKFLNTF